MSLEDFTHEKWIENIKERQAIEFKKHKGTSFGIYLELLGETITQNYEAFQSQKAITEIAVKENAELRAENEQLRQFMTKLPDEIMQIDSFADLGSPFPMKNPTEEEQAEWFDEFISLLDDHVRGCFDDAMFDLNSSLSHIKGGME